MRPRESRLLQETAAPGWLERLERAIQKKGLRMANSAKPSNSKSYLFLAGPPLVGLAALIAFSMVTGELDLTSPAGLIITLVALPPFLIVGLFASRASKQATLIGWCTCMSGLVALFGLFLEGHREYQQAMHDHHWTGASLTTPVFLFLAYPVSAVASSSGRVTGSIIGLGQSRPGTGLPKNAKLNDKAFKA
jgi:hypothetical protein